MFIEFPLPMLIPSSVKMDFSDLPTFAGCLCTGPGVRRGHQLYEEPRCTSSSGTSTACGVGERQQLYAGRGVLLPWRAFVYKRSKSRKTAILGAIAGAAVMAVFSVPSNYFITYPAYVQFYHAAGSYF